MKFTEYEMEVLQSFREINPSIVFHPGNKVATISNNKNILAVADFPAFSFPKKAPIYDLGNLINSIKTLSYQNTADVEFQEQKVDIVNRGSRIKYYYAEERMVTQPPDSIQDLGEPVVSTKLDITHLIQIQKIASTYQLPDICFTGFEGKLTAVVTDKRNKTSNSLEIGLGSVDKDFCFCLKIENLSVIRPSSATYNPCTGYKLDIFGCKVAKFTGLISKNAENSVGSLEYLIALEPDSEY